jgi:hypothetical protein
LANHIDFSFAFSMQLGLYIDPTFLSHFAPNAIAFRQRKYGPSSLPAYHPMDSGPKFFETAVLASDSQTNRVQLHCRALSVSHGLSAFSSATAPALAWAQQAKRHEAKFLQTYEIRMPCHAVAQRDIMQIGD